MKPPTTSVVLSEVKKSVSKWRGVLYVHRMNHFIAWVGCVLLCCSAFGANWPEWRGDKGLGITTETNLPVHWDHKENIRWKTALPDRGNSTPIVWGNKIFITQAIEALNRRLVVCYDKFDGKKLWEAGTTFADGEESHEANPPCSSSPVTDGERVIAWFGSAGVYCYDFKGKELWHRDLGKQSHTWGYAASPVIYKDLCILNFGPGKRSFLIALDKKTGNTVWQVDVPEVQPQKRTDGFAGQSNGEIGSWSTPIVVRGKGRDELIVSLPEKLAGFDPATGKELWRCSGLNPLIYSSVIYGEGVVVAMGGFHGATIAVQVGGNGDVTTTHKLWERPRTDNYLGCGVIFRGHIYVQNTPGLGECIELKTGKSIWKERLNGKGPKNESWSSMVLSGDKIYTLNQSGDCIVLRASPKFQVLETNSIGNELTNGSLAVSDGQLFIRTHKNLWCISHRMLSREEKRQPIKALFLTGGGYHDYDKLAPHLTKELSKLAFASFDVQFGLEILKNKDFAEPYEVIVYDVCFDEGDAALLENAMAATQAGKPTVMIHCAVHAFRKSEKIKEWENCCGMRSKVHDPYQSFSTQKMDAKSPITKAFPADWKTPGDELYQTIEFLPGSHALLKAKSPTDGREHIVCWTQTYGKGRVFATTLGHDMKTAESPDYLRLLANGLLWACDELNEQGQPKFGYSGSQ